MVQEATTAGNLIENKCRNWEAGTRGLEESVRQLKRVGDDSLWVSGAAIVFRSGRWETRESRYQRKLGSASGTEAALAI